MMQKTQEYGMAYDNDNIFAKILRHEIPAVKVFEDEHTLAFMDVMPQAQGHTLIIPKEAAENLLELSSEGAARLIQTTQKIARAVNEALKPDGVMINQFNGAAAGQSVFHVHMHVVPRWDGVRLGGHSGAMADPAELEERAAKIRAAL
jgi:histidine triad (HIT) family protein